MRDFFIRFAKILTFTNNASETAYYYIGLSFTIIGIISVLAFIGFLIFWFTKCNKD